MAPVLHQLVFVLAVSSSALAQPRVIITEIMYNPASRENYGETEWVEIANVGDEAIEIKNWRLDDEDKGDWGPFSCTLQPGRVAVLVNEDAVNEEAFHAAWDQSEASADAAKYLVIPVNWQSLSNKAAAENETLQLLDGQRNAVCEINYENGGHWPDVRWAGGPSIWLTDLTAKNLSVGKLWRKSEAGKDGARCNRLTKVFNGQDIGSPGFVPGLTEPVAPTTKPAATQLDDEDDNTIDV